MHRQLILGLTILTLGPLLLSAVDENNWPQFRGPKALGVSDNPDLPDKWGPTENVLWKREIAGRGWSSPVVWGNRLFLTTAINEGKTEEPKKGLYFGGNRAATKNIHRWKVLCLDLNSGEVLWEKLTRTGKPQGSIHIKNSYATEFPRSRAIHDHRPLILPQFILGHIKGLGDVHLVRWILVPIAPHCTHRKGTNRN